MFHQNEVQIISKTLELIRYYISKNKNQFQTDILNEINRSLQILKPANSNSLKGASSASTCPKQALKNIKNLFGLN